MHVRSILNVLAAILTFLGLTMLFAAAWSFYYSEPDLEGILMSSGITIAVSLPVWFMTRGKINLSVKDGFAIVTLVWFAVALFSALPFIMTGAIPSLVDAFFESMSGVTTTGASILGNPETHPHLTNGIESLSKGVLFWRSFTQWIGGMGIIVFSIAILPLLGVGGVLLFRAELPGPVPDKIKPRVQETAKSLWIIYTGLTAIQVVLLSFGGMSFFDSLCHSFTTVAIGGFSTKNASIAHFNSAYIEYVIIIFMFITPGTPRIVIISYSMNYGVKNCVWTALGDVTANIIQATLVIFVIGSFISDNPMFLNTFKWIGIIYLIYLAYDIYKSRPKSINSEEISKTIKIYKDN